MRKIFYPSATYSNMLLHISGGHIKNTETLKPVQLIKWDKVFKSRPSKTCGRQPLKNLKGYSLLSRP